MTDNKILELFFQGLIAKTILEMVRRQALRMHQIVETITTTEKLLYNLHMERRETGKKAFSNTRTEMREKWCSHHKSSTYNTKERAFLNQRRFYRSDDRSNSRFNGPPQIESGSTIDFQGKINTGEITIVRPITETKRIRILRKAKIIYLL